MATRTEILDTATAVWLMEDNLATTTILDRQAWDNLTSQNGNTEDYFAADAPREYLNGSFSFNGTDRYTTGAKNSSLYYDQDEYSWSFWIKASPQGENKTPWTHWRSGRYNWVILTDDSGGLVLRISDNINLFYLYDDFVLPGAIDGDWHHIAFTIGDGDVTGYLDGEQVLFETGSYRLQDIPFASDMRFGIPYTIVSAGNFPGSTEAFDYFSGNLAEACLWNLTLSAEDILTLAAAPKSAYKKRFGGVPFATSNQRVW